ncbi:MAG TPA: nickel pincer cofactor biosynthesis protein LarB [Candidatus Acidoferrum sp.]|nr:nickel pincer cofactor biosynthesis protein LarB [Candidatus Acidoferrum sp.]
MREILEKLARGTISVDEAEKELKFDIVEKVTSIARLDVARELRRGVPEIVFGEGKSVEDLLAISERMLDKNGRVILTRVDNVQLASLEARFDGKGNIRKFPHSKSVVIKRADFELRQTGGRVGILTAGTVDLAVAEDAEMIANEMGCSTFLEADAGVAGIHRLIEPLRDLIKNDVDSLIVVAGREGALPTVVAGLVDIPLIAVPASSGYGYGGGGRAALMAMLQACSLGLAVVNIDSGIAAGVVAAQIANRVAKARKGN